MEEENNSVNDDTSLHAFHFDGSCQSDINLGASIVVVVFNDPTKIEGHGQKNQD